MLTSPGLASLNPHFWIENGTLIRSFYFFFSGGAKPCRAGAAGGRVLKLRGWSRAPPPPQNAMYSLPAT
jgi:hypothetical protein